MKSMRDMVVVAVLLLSPGTARAEVFSYSCTCDPADRADDHVSSILSSRLGNVSFGDIVRILDTRLDEDGSQYEVDWQWQGGDFEAVATRRFYLAGGGGLGPGNGGPSGGPGQWGTGTGGSWSCGTVTGGGVAHTDCVFVPLVPP